MEKFKTGDKAKIIEMPQDQRHRIGDIVIIGSMGGLGPSPHDVHFRFSDGSFGVVADHQLQRTSI